MITSRTFRVFVSSTFADLKAERNALRHEVWPKLRELCARRGARFQEVDLRWGVSENAYRDNRTMEICFSEIERCRRTSPRPNFLVLLGDRYGWLPAPVYIPTSEFEEIGRRAGEPDRELLSTSYRRDRNAVPEHYVLLSRSKRQEALWPATERRLTQAFRTVLADGTIRVADRSIYEDSATAQEIARGARTDRVPDAQEHVFCFLRTIEGLPPDGSARGYVDLLPDGTFDAEMHARHLALRRELADELGDNVSRFTARWTDKGPTLDHLDALCTEVFLRLAAVIEAELDVPQDGVVLGSDHVRFGAKRCRSFRGRRDVLTVIADYLDGDTPVPLVVTGASGSGKTATMARGAQLADDPDTILVRRFVGSTPETSTGRGLLEGLQSELAKRLGLHEPEAGKDVTTLEQELRDLLIQAPVSRRIVVFVDALDQLPPDDIDTFPGWLPAAQLPAHVRVVVSSANENNEAGGPTAIGHLRQRLPLSAFVELPPLTSDEAASMLDAWLADVGRTLVEKQRAHVLAAAADCPLPLYLRLVFEEARRWRSFDFGLSGPPRLAPDIGGAVRVLLARLADDANHGMRLVSHALGYLAAGRHGLSESELLDLLSADNDVLDELRRRSPRSPSFDRLPIILWSRLRSELSPFLAQHAADGTTVLAFYHRQLRKVVELVYLAGKVRRKRHMALAAYFERSMTMKTGPRMLSELPFQLRKAHREHSLFVPKSSVLEVLRGVFSLARDVLLEQAIKGSVIDGTA